MITIKKRSLAVVIVISLVVGMFAAGAGIMAVFRGPIYTTIRTADFIELEQMQRRHSRLDQLIHIVDEMFYTDVDTQDLWTGIYRGLFQGLGDVNSSYLTAAEYDALQTSLSHEFYGIGITFSANEQQNLIIVNTMDDSPAQRAGLRAGDIIWEVDGVRYTGSEMTEAGAHMRGPYGTDVTLTIIRDGEARQYEITRASIALQSVRTEMLENDIGYVRISTFGTGTGEDFRRELAAFEEQGVRGMVIDLRNNAGGMVISGKQIADMLLPEATIVYLVDNTGRKEPTMSDSNMTNIPYVLLVNGSTASTSEILAAAVQDNGGGKIVGTRTFGKGTVQSVFPLADGSGSAIRLTTRQYLSPSGREINRQGIEPDYVVELVSGSDHDYQLEKAIRLLTGL